MSKVIASVLDCTSQDAHGLTHSRKKPVCGVVEFVYESVRSMGELLKSRSKDHDPLTRLLRYWSE